MKTGEQRQLFVFLYFGVLQLYFQKASAEDATMCGSSEADPQKTCISLRLPWQDKPIYFCVEKDKFKYRKQSSMYGDLHLHHCGNEHNENKLLVATPWDNCPLSSVPDPCVDAQCPSEPFNRTCSLMPPSENERIECCGKYFCESGTKEDCKFKILEPECSSPKNKMNCSVFIDPHGCCPKYQCEGDGKPGVCPSASKNYTDPYPYPSASHRRHRMEMLGMPAVPEDNSEPNLADVDSSVSNTPAVTEANGTTSSPSPKEISAVGSSISTYGHRGISRMSKYMATTSCVGDFTCPGTMKCCSMPSLYGYEDIVPQMQAVTGYCVEPVAE